MAPYYQDNLLQMLMGQQAQPSMDNLLTQATEPDPTYQPPQQTSLFKGDTSKPALILGILSELARARAVSKGAYQTGPSPLMLMRATQDRRAEEAAKAKYGGEMSAVESRRRRAGIQYGERREDERSRVNREAIAAERAAERESEQEFRAGESAKDIAARAEQGRLDREARDRWEKAQNATMLERTRIERMADGHDKVVDRQVADEQRTLLGKAKDAALGMADQIEAGAMNPATARSKFKRIAEAHLIGPYLKEAMAWFDLQVGPMLEPNIGPTREEAISTEPSTIRKIAQPSFAGHRMTR